MQNIVQHKPTPVFMFNFNPLSTYVQFETCWCHIIFQVYTWRRDIPELIWVIKVGQLPLMCPPLPPPFACLAASVSAATSVWHTGERCPAWNAWVPAAADSSPDSRSFPPVCSAKSSSALPSLFSAGSADAPPPALMEWQATCQQSGALGESPGAVLHWVRQTEISNFHQ